MPNWVLIAVGGSLGAVSRYGVSRLFDTVCTGVFPLATLFVNATGSFVIGVLYVVFDRTLLSESCKAFLSIGFLGAYTTFSTYSLDTVNLMRDGVFRLGMLNLILSNGVCLLMAFFGIALSRWILRVYI